MTEGGPLQLQLLHAVIHKLEKEANEPAHIVEASACLGVEEEPLRMLLGQVQSVYTKRESKSYGKFDPELTAASAESHLTELRDAEAADFLVLSKRLMQVLKAKTDAQNFATGGHVLMFHFAAGEARWFLVAILNSAAGTMINDELKVVRAPHLDVDGVRFAGRVNFTEWAAGGKRYISFLRGKKNDVSQYFQRFLGCSTVEQDLNDTRNLVKVVKQFALDKALPEADREALLAAVNHLALQRAKDKLPLDLAELANSAWPTDPDALREAFAQAQIPDGFVPRQRGLDGLVRFTAKAPKWKLEFEREVIQDHTIEFDEDSGTLTINNLPADVIAKLQQEFRAAEQHFEIEAPANAQDALLA